MGKCVQAIRILLLILIQILIPILVSLIWVLCLLRV